jgi:hypothetical protein
MVSRLPITIRPAAKEIAVSYLARLAALHDLPLSGLWSQVSRSTGQHSRRLDVELLATVANQPHGRLARALIELCDPEPDWWALRHEPQRGCPRCDAAHPGGPVLRLLGHHDYVCTRHRIWLGPPDHTSHSLPSLDQLPEVVTAQHKHRRLLRRLGPAATFDAILTGFVICAHRWSRGDTDPAERGNLWHHWIRRAAQLIPPGTETATFSSSRLFAATYPEAVHLAPLIGELRWRRLAAGGPTDQRRFTTEIGRRLGLPDYLPRQLKDPISYWIQNDSWRRPSLPTGNYRTARTFAGTSYRKPSAHHEQARRYNAMQFADSRYASNAMLSHRHLAAVVFRDWQPRTEPFDGMLPTTQPVSLGFLPTGSYEDRIKTATLSKAVFVRPAPATSTFLDAAVEPVGWTPLAEQQDGRTAQRPWPDEAPTIHRRRQSQQSAT